MQAVYGSFDLEDSSFVWDKHSTIADYGSFDHEEYAERLKELDEMIRPKRKSVPNESRFVKTQKELVERGTDAGIEKFGVGILASAGLVVSIGTGYNIFSSNNLSTPARIATAFLTAGICGAIGKEYTEIAGVLADEIDTAKCARKKLESLKK